MWLIKLPVKILAFPFVLILTLAEALFKALAGLSCYVLGPFMLFLVICGIYHAVLQQWNQTLILGGLLLCCLILFFAGTFIIILLDSAREWLRGI